MASQNWYSFLCNDFLNATLMNRIFTIACSVAMLSISFASHAQPQDPAIARVDEQISKKSLKTPLEMPAATAEGEETTKGFVVPNAPVDKKSPEWILEHKVGPNGEEILLENNSFYYLNDGQPVNIDLAELKDKPKSS